MTSMKNAMDILKVLPKNNCKACHEPTCLVFAVNVFQGRKHLKDCPYIKEEVISDFDPDIQKNGDGPDELLEHVESLKEKIRNTDLREAALRTGAEYSDGTLVIKVFGKDFRIDRHANLSSAIHMHPWIVIPLLNYVLNCGGVELSGKWATMRDLKGGMAWEGLFQQRCEKPLKKIIDEHMQLFDFMTQIFNANTVSYDCGSDVSIVLKPLVKFPILIRYWKSDEGLESSLSICFDTSAPENMDMDSIYALGAGLVRMFEKIADTHAC